ncbi:DUF6069 family protein [Embleya sp. NBC_00888]|uniref:DUF6069 family protein n=1 Tax=Embleya sp. NBC_00888 TaxID=2975960 RepID=UPI0038673728
MHRTRTRPRLAVGVVRRTARPQQTFIRIALALTTLWLALPLAPNRTTTSAGLLLAGGHVPAAAIFIPGPTWVLRRAPRHRRPSHAAEKRAWCLHTPVVGSPATHAPEDPDEISLWAVSDRVEGVRSRGERSPKWGVRAWKGRTSS